MKPIRYFGDIVWFSQKKTAPSYGSVGKALRAHIRYISNEKRDDLIYAEGLDKEKWMRITEEETSKRWDARVAGKVIFALPNELSLEKAKSLIREFVSKEIGPSQFGFALHRPKGVVSGKDNFHAHVLFTARAENGKKLRINPTKLRELQRKWDEYLKRYTGRDPYRAPQRMRKHIRPFHVRPDSTLYDPKAVQYIQTRRRVWVLLQEAAELEKAHQLGTALQKVLDAEREQEKVSLHAAHRAARVRDASHHTEARQSLARRETSLRVQLDKPFQDMPIPSVWDSPSMKLADRRRALEDKKRALEWELETTSRLRFLKRMSLKQQIRTIEEQIREIERKEEQMSKFDRMTRQWLKEHIEMLYKRPDVSPWIHQIAILAVHPNGERKQFLVKIDELEQRISYLRKLNAAGFNIYASVNILQPDAQSRKAEDFLPYQTALYLDLDSKQKSASQLWKEIWEEIQLGRLPEPSYVLKSSKGNYQVYWIFQEPIEHWKLSQVMKALNERFGLDHTQDVARVFRLPGFRNKKEGKDDLVQPPKGDVLFVDKEKGYKVRITKRKYPKEVFEELYNIWVPEDLAPERLSEPLREEKSQGKVLNIKPTRDPALEELYRVFYKRRDRYASLSEVDMAFTIKALSKGYSQERVASFLALQRSDKKDPEYYAKHTVEKGIAYLKRQRESSHHTARRQSLRRRETSFDPSFGPSL